MVLNAARILIRNFAVNRAFRSVTAVNRNGDTRFSNRNFTTKLRFQSKHLSPYSYQWRISTVPTFVYCFGGIMALLGFERSEKDDPITDTIKRGILALDEKDFNKAEKLLHLALTMSQSNVDENAITYCYDVLANIAYERGDYPKAEKLFVETMKRMISTGTSMDDNAIVEMSLKIATMNGLAKHDEKAEQGYRFCIETQRKKTLELNLKAELSCYDRDSFLLLGLSMDYFADYLFQRGQYAEARQMWIDALEISRAILGHVHEQSLVIYSNLALVCRKLGNLAESTEILKNIVSMTEVENSADLAIFLCNLGMNYIAQQNFTQAEEVLERAKLSAQKFKDKLILQEINELLELIHTTKQV